MVEKALFPLIYDKIPSIFSVTTFTDYIPTFLGPKAFFNPKESVQLLFGYGWIAIIIYQFYTVLSFLRQYYILGDINSEVKGLSFNHRIFIYVSYLLLDLIYPISFVLLLYFYRTGILTRTEQSLRRDCDDSRQFESNQAGIARIYLMGFTYLFFHCVLLTIWLYPVLGNTWNLQLRFWVIDFGIPHALNPILLQCHISHIVLVFNARIELFRKDICNGHFECKDDLWHTYRRCRNSINRLSECLKYILGFFCLSLALAILLQGIAVFIFQGDIGSLTYMVLNIFVLLSVMYESQTLAKTFSDMCEDIIHLPADSVLGTMGSEVRQAFMVVLKRTDLYPSLSAFGIFQFSMENFYNAFILSLGSVASVLWVRNLLVVYIKFLYLR